MHFRPLTRQDLVYGPLMSSPKIPLPQAGSTVLILPFTLSTLLHPEPLLPIITQAIHCSSKSLLVILSTQSGEQLYATLHRNPKTNWVRLQRFLGKIYAPMVTAQWAVGRVLMDVEVRFEGEDGDWEEKLGVGAEQTVKLQGGIRSHR